MQTLVVGAGEMGRWLARVILEDTEGPVEMSFLDADAEQARRAASEIGGRAVTPETDESFDLVCIAVPIPVATEAIETYASLADAAIIDVAGTMSGPIESMRDHAPGCERASLHPLFSSANEPGNVPLVVDASGPITDRIVDALETRGNTVFETTAAEHDRMMETVQAKAHAAILAFALASEAVPDEYQTTVSTQLEALVSQVTGGDPRVYGDIQAAFDGAGEVADAAHEIAEADRETFEALFEDSRR